MAARGWSNATLASILADVSVHHIKQVTSRNRVPSQSLSADIRRVLCIPATVSDAELFRLNSATNSAAGPRIASPVRCEAPTAHRSHRRAANTNRVSHHS
ncbi:MAG: hypothetical protein JSS75_07435 [Bacteroidetes bacterium]|nr:hypothetical protein [Bacteroidota bacterium]